MRNLFSVPIKSHTWLNLWFVFLAVITFLYILWNYPLYRMFQNLSPIGFALVFMIGFTGWGWPVARYVLRTPDKWDEILTASIFGLGLTGLFVFIPGIMGLVNTTLYALWILCGLLIAAYYALKLIQTIRKERIRTQTIPSETQTAAVSFSLSDGLNVFGIVVSVFFILLAIPPLVTPVVSTDALQYHLLIPKIFLAAGKIGYIPSLVESNYPNMAEYIYMPVMAVGGDVVCKSFHFWGGICVLIALFRLTRKIDSDAPGFLAPAFFASMPVAIVIFSWAWNDLFFVFFLLVCLSHFLNYHLSVEKNQYSMSLFAAGICAGLAFWQKYTFIMVFFVLGILLLIGMLRWKWKWQHLYLFFIPSGLLSLLVLIKNDVFTGNPVYPFLHRVFPSPYWNETAAAYFFNALRRWEFADWNWTTYFTFPFHLTMKPRLIDTHTGILPLVFIPFLFMVKKGKGLSFLKYFILVYMGVWLFFQTETRSLLFFLGVFFVVASVSIGEIIRKNPLFRRPLLFFLSLAIVTNMAVTMVTNYHLTQPMAYFLGFESRQSFLRREAKSQLTYEWLNKNQQVGAVLLVGFFGPYYLERPVYFSSSVDTPAAEILTNGTHTPEQLRSKMFKLGITHIAIDHDQYKQDHANSLYSWNAETRKTFETFLYRFCQPVTRAGSETVFRVVY